MILAFLIKLMPFLAAAPCDTHSFFFLPTWYEYLPLKADPLGQCVPDLALNGFPANVLPIGLAILDMLVRLAGFVAVVSIIYAGVQYMSGMGNPEKAAAARKRLYNSLIGLAIALVATGFVAFIGNVIVKVK